MASSPRISSNGVESPMDNVIFVVVKGLQQQPEDEVWPGSPRLPSVRNNVPGYLWGSEWREQMGCADCPILQFDSDFRHRSSEVDFLSPAWFDRKARELLGYVSHRVRITENECRLVFFAENLGGIVLKRALFIADFEIEYTDISRYTCASVFIGVPHRASSLQEWAQIISSIVLPFWRSLPAGFWTLTAGLPNYLSRTSSDFIEVAFRISVISIYQRSFDVDNSVPLVIDISSCTLDVSHEHTVARDFIPLFTELGRFYLLSETQTGDVVGIFRVLGDAASVTLEGREYMNALSRLSPYTRFPDHKGASPVVKAIERPKRGPSASAVTLYGGHGVGKSILSYALYEMLIRNRGPAEHVTYFAFDARDHRRRSVSSMLIKTIRQLLANEPTLIDKVLGQIPGDKMRWTEGNLWIQLRSIIRQMHSSSIHIIIDSVTDCDVQSQQAYLRCLFDLRFAAPDRLRIWGTSTSEVHVDTWGYETVNLSNLPEFEESWTGFQDSLVDALVSQSPRLVEAKKLIKKCLHVSEGFLHATLIAHRIRGINSLSRPTFTSADLEQLSTGFKDTILGMVGNAPPWAFNAVSWMMFARRPLKPMELSILVALVEAHLAYSDSNTPRDVLPPVPVVCLFELDESFIPLDIEGDLRRKFGPLVNFERGEIRISHAYVGDVLLDLIVPKEEDKILRSRTLTRLMLEYMHLCLRKIAKGRAVPKENVFSFLEYALEHWHIHYREAMDNVVRPETPGEDSVEQLARNLFQVPEYLYWLQPWNNSNLKHDARGRLGSSGIAGQRDIPLRPVLLAAQLGLFDIFWWLLDRKSEADRLDALRISCQHGHLKIVKSLIQDTKNTAVMDALLSKACELGDEAVVMTLINRLQVVAPEWKVIPSRLLIKICQIGHTSLAGRLIIAGAEADAYSSEETPPLHAALEQGHLDVVDLLLNNGADANCLGKRRWTALQRSISRGYSHICNRLLQEDGLVDNVNDDGLTSAHLAARVGDVALLEKVIDLPRPNNDESKGREEYSLPLHCAAANGHLEAVKLLLKPRGSKPRPSVNDVDSAGRTALVLALAGNYAPVVDYLFENGATVAVGGDYADSALKQAIIHGNLPATIAILKANEDPNGGDSTDSSPLTDAAWRDYGLIARALIMEGADIDRTVDRDEIYLIIDEESDSAWAPIHFAAYYGSLEVMDLLIRRNPDGVNAKTGSEHTPLHLAVSQGHVDVVHTLLPLLPRTSAAIPGERKGSVSNRSSRSSSAPRSEAAPPRLNVKTEVNAVSEFGRTPLHIAAVIGDVGLVDLLLAAGASVMWCDIERKSSLHFAAASTSSTNSLTDVMRALLSAGADPGARDSEGRTPLHHAALGGSNAAVSLLLREKSPVDTADDGGNTPLFLAAQRGHATVVMELFAQGADINARTRDGSTPLHAAAFKGNLDVVIALLSRGARVDASNDLGDTPLHEAARRGHYDVVQKLIQEEADLDAVNSQKITPLQRAIMNNWYLTAKLLLDQGANPNLPDEDGDTALMAALYSQERAVVNLLLKRDDQDKLVYNVNLNAKNEQGNTPLRVALRAPDMLRALVDAGVDVSTRAENGFTIIHEMTSRTSTPQHSEDMFQLLNHARVKEYLDTPDTEGLTPMHLAARRGNTLIMTALRRCGADISVKDRQGRTAMHHAVRTLSKGAFKVVFGDFLRPGEGNKVNVPDADGWTPLHWACKGSSLGVVEMLLAGYEHPVQALRYEDKYGWSAMAVAIFHCKNEIVKAIERSGIAMDPDWNRHDAPPSFSVSGPPGSAEIALKGRGDDLAVNDAEALTSNRVPAGWETAVRNGLRSDGKKVAAGEAHRGVYCDDCCYAPLYGIRFKCRTHPDFDLCFKCYRHQRETHHPKGHEFALGHHLSWECLLEAPSFSATVSLDFKHEPGGAGACDSSAIAIVAPAIVFARSWFPCPRKHAERLARSDITWSGTFSYGATAITLGNSYDSDT